jgi:hypothetical protein
MLYWDYGEFLTELNGYMIRRWGYQAGIEIEVFKLQPSVNYIGSTPGHFTGTANSTYNPWNTDSILIVVYDKNLHGHHISRINNFFKDKNDFVEKSLFASAIIDNFYEVFLLDTVKSDITALVSDCFSTNLTLSLKSMSTMVKGGWRQNSLITGSVNDNSISNSFNAVSETIEKKSLCDCGAQKLGYTDDSDFGHAHWCSVRKRG